MRILIDNPGDTFTCNFDAKFIDTARDVLRYGKDGYTQLFLRETLEILEATRWWDANVTQLLDMFQKEKEITPSAFRKKVSASTYLSLSSPGPGPLSSPH